MCRCSHETTVAVVCVCVRADYWGYGHQSSTDFSEIFRSHPQILGARMLRKHLPQLPSKVDFGIRMSGTTFWVFAFNTRWNGRIRTRGFCLEAQILFIRWLYFYVHLPHLTPCLLGFLLHFYCTPNHFAFLADILLLVGRLPEYFEGEVGGF